MTINSLCIIIGTVLFIFSVLLVSDGWEGCLPQRTINTGEQDADGNNKETGIDGKATSSLVAISGIIVPIGHEPFVELALKTPEGVMYVIRGEKELELYKAQGKPICIKGYLEVIGSPRSRQYINVKNYDLLNLQNDILSLQIKSILESRTIDFVDGNYIIDGNKGNIVDRSFLAKLHNSVSDAGQSILKSEESSVNSDKCYLMLKILYTQRVPITLCKPSGTSSSFWIIEEHKKKNVVESLSVTNVVVSIIKQLGIVINDPSL